MTQVLVTGGAGFIGSHLTAQLLSQGYKVVVLDSLIYGKREWIPKGAQFIHGDIRDMKSCQQAMENVAGVFHCAAMSRAGPSMAQMDWCTEVNIKGTYNILSAAKTAGVKKIIYSGSSTYYGNQPVPHREYETPPDFMNIYALSKYTGEQYCLLFDKCFDLPCVILRYFNVYGPRQPEEGAYALVLGIFLRQRSLNQTLTIHGGKQTRDFIHVNDVVAANIAAFESPVRHVTYNIGSGTTISIQSLADLISSKQQFSSRRAHDADATLADITRAQQELPWTPTVSLKEGLAELMPSYEGCTFEKETTETAAIQAPVCPYSL